MFFFKGDWREFARELQGERVPRRMLRPEGPTPKPERSFSMSCLWVQTSDGRWHKHALPIPSHELTSCGVHIATIGSGVDRVNALFTHPGVSVRVSGQPVLGGVCVLQHRDEILVNGVRIFFSSESRPEIVDFRPVAGVRLPKCGICRVVFQDGDRVVACPQCGRVFHENDASDDLQVKKCWTYRAHCLCSHPTSLSGDTWRPEMEEPAHA